MARRVRWGHLHELDRRFRINSPGYQQYPNRLKHLHSWRTMHAVAGDHMPVRMSGTRQGVRPSSDMTLLQKNKFIKKRS